ncbi:MAG: IPT/TIG domain-containing protein [Acidobacteriota bacterium]
MPIRCSVNYRAILLLSLAPALWGQTATLTPTPVNLAFTWQSGLALPSAKTLAVKSGSSAAAYTVAISPPTALWLSVSPDAGFLPAALTVRVNPSSLGVGTYNASITVTAAGFGSPSVIPVTLTVTAPLPTLVMSASTLDFATPANPPADQTITLYTTGGPISFTAAPQGATWMTISPRSGVVLPGLPTVLTVSVDSSSLSPQTTPYSGKIVVTATGVPAANKTQNVTVNLTANASTPTITSLWPSAALVNTGPLTLTIRGTGFFKGTTAKVTGQATPLKITFISATILLADLPASLITTASTLSVVATNPAPGGDSIGSDFTVSSTPVVQAVVSAASYSSAAVSPGELVTLFGSGIGPATAANLSVTGGYVTQLLQNVSVTIDGQNAAMVYVSRDQITVQVPYEATVGTARTVAVNNGGVIASGLVDIMATSPGLFALDGSGTGQAAALTFSMQTGLFAVNGAAAPARANDIVVLYLTGEGDYATLITPRTGFIVPGTLTPLPQLNPLPVVTMGGAPATVQYAGPMIGGILGLLQVNVVVPAAATKGNAVAVSLDIGGVVTQTGVTLALK